jgi:hypothetical protein
MPLIAALAVIAASSPTASAQVTDPAALNPICDPTPGGTCDPTKGVSGTVAAAEDLATSSTLGWGSWAAYEGVEAIRGSVHVAADGREVWGTLPPGYSIAQFVDQPGLETLAAVIAAGADTSGLVPYARDGGSNNTVAGALGLAASARDESHNGCVSAFSYIRSDGLRYKGQMAGCRRGTLWLHIYLNANGRRVDDGGHNTCSNSTECSLPYAYYGEAPRCRVFTNYAHGRNRTTGGEDYAWEEHHPAGRWC